MHYFNFRPIDQVEETTGIMLCDDMYGKTCILKRRRFDCDVQKEVDIMRTIHHKNIIQLLDVHQFDAYADIYLAYGGASMFTFLAKFRDKMTPCNYFFFMREIANGVHYLHTNRIAHRDIKLENIVIDGNQIKLIDFGLSHRYDVGDADCTLYQRCGSRSYCCPEIVYRQVYSGYAADIWSCGIVFYTMLFNNFPFVYYCWTFPVVKGATVAQQMGKSLVKFVQEFYGKKIHYSDETIALLDKMLQVEPQKRCSIHDVVQTLYNETSISQMDALKMCAPIVVE